MESESESESESEDEFCIQEVDGVYQICNHKEDEDSEDSTSEEEGDEAEPVISWG